jgi:hypothetical protein
VYNTVLNSFENNVDVSTFIFQDAAHSGGINHIDSQFLVNTRNNDIWTTYKTSSIELSLLLADKRSIIFVIKYVVRRPCLQTVAWLYHRKILWCSGIFLENVVIMWYSAIFRDIPPYFVIFRDIPGFHNDYRAPVP